MQLKILNHTFAVEKVIDHGSENHTYVLFTNPSFFSTLKAQCRAFEALVNWQERRVVGADEPEKLQFISDEESWETFAEYIDIEIRFDLQYAYLTLKHLPENFDK